MTEPLRIAWLTTGRGPGSYGALKHVVKAIDDGLPVRIAVLFINREAGEAEATDQLVAMAEAADITVERLSSVRFRKERGGKLSRPGESLQPWRLDYDLAVAEILGRHEFDLGVMFGYMLIATEPLFSRFTFINDHPALPDGPVGTYQEVIAELIRSGVDESGCMMNVVTGDVDRGAVVSYCRFSIADAGPIPPGARTAGTAELVGTPLFDEIRRRGVERERPFLVETLREVAEGGIRLPPEGAVDLTTAVEEAIEH